MIKARGNEGSTLARGPALVLLAVLIWSTQAFVTKLLVTSLSFIWVYLFSSLLAGVSLLALYFLFNKDASTRKLFKKPKQVLIISVLLGASNFLLFASFSMLEASSVVITLYIYPILMALFNSALFTKKFDARELAGMLFGFFGIVVFATGGSLTSLHLQNPYAYPMVLGGAIAWALYLILQKHFGLEVTSSNGVAFLVSALFVLPLLPFVVSSSLASLLSPQTLTMLIYFGIVTFGIANMVYLMGLRSTRVINAALSSYLTPVIAVVLNFLVLGELIFWYDLVPIFLIFIGFLIINWGSIKVIILPMLHISPK